MNKASLQDWLQRAEAIKPEGKAFIDGRYVDDLAAETFEDYSPIDGRLLAQVARCQSADVTHAVQAARRAFNQGVWSDLAPMKCKKILQRLAELILTHREDFALLETLDMGKPISTALEIDVQGAANCIQWCAEAIDKLYGEIAPTGSDELGLITREPVGVVASIVPWNFPLMMACWKVGPALASGNSVILKPSEKSPLSAIFFAQLASEAGIPEGVFSVLPGFGAEVGKALALHQDIDTLAFTGSTRTAKQLLIYAGESNMKRVWLEAGGKSPNIVFADAPDLDEAALAAAAGIAFNQGEVCAAGSRLLVENSIRKEFVARVVKALENWQPGHPLDPNTSLGAIVDHIQLDNILKYINIGVDEGAELVCGGSRADIVAHGYYVQPTLFDKVDNKMRIAQDEIFGPVVAVIGFDSEEEAIAIANDSIYGLAAGIWTRDIFRAHRVSRALHSGSVWVNQYNSGDMTAPFGGYRQSGNGRDKSMHAFEKYTEIKATWIKI